MNMFNSTRTYEEFLKSMAACGYSEHTIADYRVEINWLVKNQCSGISSYDEAFELRIASKRPGFDASEIKAKYNVLNRFAICGEFSSHNTGASGVHQVIEMGLSHNPAQENNAYSMLLPSFRKIIDRYVETSIQKGISSTTYKPNRSSCSCFLLYLQNKGYENLDDVREEDVLSYFYDESNDLVLGNRTKVHIASVFQSDLGDLSDVAQRMLLALPDLKNRRKNIQYLSSSESAAIRAVLSNNEMHTGLSLRNKAIGTILYYTGLRTCDIISLQLSAIDWEHDEIKIIQSKTNYPLTLPLTATVGNAIYDYIVCERPRCDLQEVFVSAKAPHIPIGSGAVRLATDKIYAAAGVRQLPGDRKGSHIFRHNLVTTLSENSVSRAIITSVVGHSNPASINHYLSSDIENLRTCALSIDAFPVKKEVFNI